MTTRKASSARLRFNNASPRVAVFRALQLGDLLCATPALRALRAGLPGAHIVLVGLPWARCLVERLSDYLDDFQEFPGWPGLPERLPAIERIPRFLSALQAEHFDLALQLHGAGSTVNELVALFGAERCAGFYSPSDYRPDPPLFMPWPSQGREIHRLLSLITFLGLPPRGHHLEFPLTPQDHLAAAALLGCSGLKPGEYVCIHPGASVASRRWPAEHFAVVARALHDRGLHLVVTGIAPEIDLAMAVAQGCEAPCVILTGRTDLGSLGAVLQGARLLVCNDTGVSHLADALQVPSVVISSGFQAERWAPLNAGLHRVLCGLAMVQPEQVIAEVDDLLDQEWTPQASRESVMATSA